jgi:hypothetical protein
MTKSATRRKRRRVKDPGLTTQGETNKVRSGAAGDKTGPKGPGE